MQSLVKIHSASEPIATKVEGRVMQTLVLEPAETMVVFPDGSVGAVDNPTRKTVTMNMFMDAGARPFMAGKYLEGKIFPRVPVLPYADKSGKIQTFKALIVFDGQTLDEAATAAGHKLRSVVGALAATPAPTPAVALVEEDDD